MLAFKHHLYFYLKGIKVTNKDSILRYLTNFNRNYPCQSTFMGDQLANNPEALRLFFTEDVFIVPEPVIEDGQFHTSSVQSPVLAGHVSEIGALGTRTEEVATEAAKIDASSHLQVHDDEVLSSPDLSVPAQINAEAAVPEAEVNAAEVEVLRVGASTTAGRKDLVFLGQNKRNILILVNDANYEVSSEQGRELLKNIVKAINLSGVDFALLNYSAYPGMRFEQLQEFFASKVLFAFGVSAAQMGLEYKDQNTLIIHEGIKMIFSANLDELSTDIPGKKALWSCLKQMDI
jgi:hypothetical protein